nr:MAG TPA: hypothetical protein [Caudoviricetes sp.]
MLFLFHVIIPLLPNNTMQALPFQAEALFL